MSVQSGDERTLGHGCVESGKLLHAGACLSRTANKDVVRNAEAEQTAPAVCAEDGTELVLDVVTSGRVQVDAVELEPSPPKDTRYPHAMPVDRSAHVVAASELDLILNVKVDDADDAVGCEEVAHTVDSRVKFWNHAQAV